MNKTNNKRQRTTANDHLDGPASCKWSSRQTILLQMIIAIDHPLAIDHLYWMTSWEWSSGWTGLSQMIIQMDRPHANNHPDWLAACKWSSAWNGLLQLISGWTALLQIILLFFSVFFTSTKNISFISKYFPPFPSPIFNFQEKYISFSKYFPPFPSPFFLLWKIIFFFCKNNLSYLREMFQYYKLAKSVFWRTAVFFWGERPAWAQTFWVCSELQISAFFLLSKFRKGWLLNISPVGWSVGWRHH